MPAQRIRIIVLLFVGIFSLYGVRLYYLQIIRNDEYTDRANRQYVRPTGAIFERGTIYFEDKEGQKIAAASLSSGYTLALNPRLITDPEKLYSELHEALPELDKESFLKMARKQEDPYEEVLRRIPESKVAPLVERKLTGVIFTKERWRVYPAEKIASQVLGFIGFGDDGKTLTGRYGLERFYERVLARTDSTLYVNFFAELFGKIRTTITASHDEGDIVMTIEPGVQARLEEELEGITKKYTPRFSGGIIMDPYTGEIYAMAGNPSFDPNNRTDANIAAFQNPNVESVMEMGSIMKAITMAIALNEGKVTPETTYTDEGFLTLDKSTIRNYDRKARGVTTMQEVINQSLNTGAAFMMQKVGKEKFAQYLFDLGLGEKTNIDLPGEVLGKVSNLKSPRDIEYATASYGHGIALTPIATIRALSALGNGGFLPTPHVVKRLEYITGISRDVTPEKGKQIWTPETSSRISQVLTTTVDTALLGGKIKKEHYTVAAKTGTAVLASADGGYYTDRYVHTFFGYFPATRPRFIILLYAYDPKGVDFASHSLTVPFSDLVDFLGSYYNVTPDR